MPDSDNITHAAAQDWTWTQSPDPAQPIFTVYVQTSLIRPVDQTDGNGNVTAPANMPVRSLPPINGATAVVPTKFRDLDPAFGVPHLVALGVGDWQFIGASFTQSLTAFHFFKNLEAGQILTPYDVQTRNGNHYWNEVVLKVWPERDDSFPISANVIKGDGTTGIITAPTIRIHALVIPDTEEGTEFITRKYLSAVYPVNPQPRTPQSDTFTIFAGQTSRTFDKVLHDDIIFPATPSGSLQNIGGTTTVVGGSMREQRFPATNFPTRKDYILSFDPVRTAEGLWDITEIEVVPPKGYNPKII